MLVVTLLLGLAAATLPGAGAAARAAPPPSRRPFAYFEPCAQVPGSRTTKGLCRRGVGGDDLKAAATGLPIDMRLPCEGGARCDEVRPALALFGLGLRTHPSPPSLFLLISCNHPLSLTPDQQHRTSTSCRQSCHPPAPRLPRAT